MVLKGKFVKKHKGYLFLLVESSSTLTIFEAKHFQSNLALGEQVVISKAAWQSVLTFGEFEQRTKVRHKVRYK